MLCDFTTTEVVGKHRHACTVCGRVITTIGPKCACTCGGLPSWALNTPVKPQNWPSCATSTANPEKIGPNAEEAISAAIEPLLHNNIAACESCADRPAGCWKAIDYGCTLKYQAAKRHASKHGSCPIGKWYPTIDRYSGDEFRKQFNFHLKMNFQPPKLVGDGIVVVGEGKFWTGIVVLAKLLREVGSKVKLIVYSNGTTGTELDDDPLTELRTFEAIKQRQPDIRLGGWENKTQALLDCGLKRVFYIDADAYFTRDPEYLFKELDDAPFAFWGDIHAAINNIHWHEFGIDREVGQKVPPVQGGHLLIDIEAFWSELCVTDWLNQQSQFTYKHGFGDQDMWRVVLAATGTKYKFLGDAQWRRIAFLVDDNIVHRCRAKLYSDTCPRRYNGLPLENRVFELFSELSGLYQRQLAEQRLLNTPRVRRAVRARSLARKK